MPGFAVRKSVVTVALIPPMMSVSRGRIRRETSLSSLFCEGLAKNLTATKRSKKNAGVSGGGNPSQSGFTDLRCECLYTEIGREL